MNLLTGKRVRVYFNLRRHIWSVQTMNERGLWRVTDHTHRILLKDVIFTVNEAGRRRVLHTRQNNVHAWVEGTALPYRSENNKAGLPPLNIWNLKELCLRAVIYNPYKYNQFVRADKTFEPVLQANYALLDVDSSTIEKQPPLLLAYRQDMWGEFGGNEAAAYSMVAEVQSHFVPYTSRHWQAFFSLVQKGVMYSFPDSDHGVHGHTFSLASDCYTSPKHPHVCRYGLYWGFWDESETHFIGKYASESLAIQAMKEYAATL